METKLAPGFHVRPGRAVDTSAYDQFTGRWSRLFVPLVLGAADLQPGDQVLDVATGTGEAAVAIMPVIGPSGRLIGAVSDWMRIRGQAARSIGLSASFWVRLCHPSTLRIVI